MKRVMARMWFGTGIVFATDGLVSDVWQAVLVGGLLMLTGALSFELERIHGHSGLD